MSIVNEEEWVHYTTEIESKDRLIIVAHMILGIIPILIGSFYCIMAAAEGNIYFFIITLIFFGIAFRLIREQWIRYTTRFKDIDKKIERKHIIFAVIPAFLGILFLIPASIEGNLFILVFAIIFYGIAFRIIVRGWSERHANRFSNRLAMKERVLSIIRTTVSSSIINIGFLLKTASVQNSDRDVIIELVKDGILLGTIDYETNHFLPQNLNLNDKQMSEPNDILTLRQLIEVQAQQIAQLESTVRLLETVQTNPSSQATYNCSICRRIIEEGEYVWTDSELNIFHSSHIKEWIRINATHPITKVKMPQELEFYEPNAMLLDGKLMNLSNPKI